jgi:bifunctional non-homologous end joining protein LigD
MPAVRFSTVEPFTPLPLERVREPFDDPACVYELKYDGFRSLAFLTPTAAVLVSRNGNSFGRFAPVARTLRDRLRVRSAVVDGEVVCLDAAGRPRFNDLLFSRGVPVFVAFDLLALDGRDLRRLPLLQRKRRLRPLIPDRSDCILYADHVVGTGRDLFSVVCRNDLEGIVAKVATAPYALVDGRSPWIKVKFRDYSQARDRHELFAR